MDHYSVILIFGIISFMGWYGCIFSTKKMIKEVGFHEKNYPKRYIMPGRKMRRIFNLNKREIPKWMYYEFIMSFVYIILFMVSTLAYLLSDNKPIVAQVFIWIYGIFMCADTLHIIVCLYLYR